MTEIWLPVVGFEGLYEVSDLGRVASLPKINCFNRRILRHGLDTDGYPQVVPCRNGKRFTRKVHHLVAEAFIGPRPSGMVMRHLDGNPENNCPHNLKWGTSEENAADRRLHGRDYNGNKTHGDCGHPLSGRNLYADPSGARHCRICRYAALDRHAAKKTRKIRRSFRGEMSATAKLTRTQVAEIRSRYRSTNERQVDIAAVFGVSQAAISAIVRRRTWQ